MSPTNLKTKMRNVNNKTLAQEIDKFMIEVFTIEHINWENPDHRDQVVEMIEFFFYELAALTGKITQFDVICDRRNNPLTIKKKGKVNLTLKYQQKNCLNTTYLDYIFTLTD